PALWAGGSAGSLVVLPLVTLPQAARLVRTAAVREDGASLNATLERTTRLSVLFALLFAAGLLLGATP
ncbi:MAG TPA: 1,4-dihydroxy-2-naphthoate polyprenyltransferase, partial [Myxococcota bacterium]